MMHIDAYTILYHAKLNTTEDEIKAFFKEKQVNDQTQLIQHIEEYSEMIKELSIECLENGIKIVSYELPPSVCKRMRKYYSHNKETLVDAFSVKLRDEILNSL